MPKLVPATTTRDRYDPIEAIKHLNNLRNRLGHRVDYRLTADDMLPFIHYMKRVGEASKNPPEHKLEGLPPKAILDLFTSIAAAVFAGSVSRTDHDKGRTERNARADPAQGKEARE
jgi:hypothetical protein